MHIKERSLVTFYFIIFTCIFSVLFVFAVGKLGTEDINNRINRSVGVLAHSISFLPTKVFEYDNYEPQHVQGFLDKRY